MGIDELKAFDGVFVGEFSGEDGFSLVVPELEMTDVVAEEETGGVEDSESHDFVAGDDGAAEFDFFDVFFGFFLEGF